MRLQAQMLEKYRDTIAVSVRTPSHLMWRGRVRPAEVSDSYVIDVDYRTDTRFVPRPRVFVIDPLLQERDGGRCPHRHGEQEPCLYYHPGYEWRKEMAIAHTIVPWASRWLYFYEIWLATGEWMGGGVHLEAPRLALELPIGR